MIRNNDFKSDCNGDQYYETPYNNNDSNIYQDRLIHVCICFDHIRQIIINLKFIL